MQIFSLFQSQVSQTDTRKLQDEVDALRRSLQRRDRRIAFLKQRLQRVRRRHERDLSEARGIIDGLEQALLIEPPRAPEADRQVEQLQAELARLNDVVDLHMAL